MLVVTPSQMKDIENYNFTVLHKSSREVMGKAGEAVAKAIMEEFPNAATVLCVCGRGNNGGDGFACANLLLLSGYAVDIYTVGDLSKQSGDASFFYEMVKQYVVDRPAKSYDVIVDALFGIGFTGAAQGDYAEAIRIINNYKNSGSKVFAVDLPSGLNGATGAVEGKAVYADETITFQYPKTGLFIGHGLDYAGKVKVIDIDLQKPESLEINTSLLTKELAKEILPVRKRCSHKGNYGHVAVLAGAPGMEGAALMSAMAALRAGAGKVTIGAKEKEKGVFDMRPWELMCAYFSDDSDFNEDFSAFLEGKDAVLIGPGLGRGENQKQLVLKLISTDKPLILDADGLNNLTRNDLEMLKHRSAPVILTPHIGEAARLLNCAGSEIESDPIGAVLELCALSNQIIVLKSAYTLIGYNGKIKINYAGNQGMATAGSGDVLSGIIAGLLPQVSNPCNAAILGVYLHATAGDCAKEAMGMYSLIATDIIKYLPDAFKNLEQT